MDKPVCYIIGGPNGAGKTTFALNCLPEITGCSNFLNADMMAYGLSPLNNSGELMAGKIFLRQIQENISKRETFAFETTLAAKTFARLFCRLNEDDYKIVLFFLWIPSAVYSYERVCERVKNGGHAVPKDTVFRRYDRVMNNFRTIYSKLCDEIYCYDNRDGISKPIFKMDSKGIFVKNTILYNEIMGITNE